MDPSALQIVSIDESFKDHFNMGTMLYLFSYSSSYTGGILTVLTHLNGARCNYYFDHERKYYADHTVLAEYDQIKGINEPSCSCSIDITDVYHDKSQFEKCSKRCVIEQLHVTTADS